ncbi:MAG TPA: hypothetical protein VFV33_14615 [Gemmatimonadaceae bacterium]|nr:hypothetical protein [Gemmatimonadaceae bacterium]
MPARRFTFRLLAALVAVVHGFAPGAASIIDARPAAAAVSERATVHFEEPGSPHAIAHQEHCVLCAVGTHAWSEPAATPALLDGGVGSWPSRADWIGYATREHPGDRRSRAPPA